MAAILTIAKLRATPTAQQARIRYVCVRVCVSVCITALCNLCSLHVHINRSLVIQHNCVDM